MNRKEAVDTRQSLNNFKASQMASAVLSCYAKMFCGDVDSLFMTFMRKGFC